jgi:DUF1016 N-terminal domain
MILIEPFLNLLSIEPYSLSKKPQFALVESFWHIGRLIVENEQNGDVKAQYGEFLVDSLATELQKIFGKGYTATNLRWARQLYLAFPIHHTTSDELEIKKVLNQALTWSHYRTLLKITNSSERNFYIEKIEEEKWSVRFLQKMIDSDFFYRQSEDYSFPNSTKKNGTRTLKIEAKNKAMLLKGWSFVHPKSLKLTTNNLIFYHIIEQVFIVIAVTAITENQLAELYKVSPSIGNSTKNILFYNVNKNNELLIFPTKEIIIDVANRIKDEFNTFKG